MTSIKEIGGPTSWRGADLRSSDEWIVGLDDAQQAELLGALASVEAAGLDFHDITRDNFPSRPPLRC